ncbi:MAG: hypothetical protein QXH27_04250, partial [Candidatus Micrarchaeia archaeon]
SGRCVSCAVQNDCAFGYCNAQVGKCFCRAGDAACLRELGMQALEKPANITLPPSINITPPLPPCEIGAYCASDADCCGGKCIGNKCECRMTGCRATLECCTGYCVRGECVSAPRAILVSSVGALQNVFQPGSGCAGLVSACTFAGCFELCNGMWLLLIVLSAAAAFMARSEKMRLVPLALALAPLLIGLFSFPFVGVLVAAVETLFFAVARKR